MRTTILISGRGSNMEALIRSAQASDYPAEISLVVSDDPNAPGLEIARQLGIRTAVADYGTLNSRAAAEEKLHKLLSDAGTDIVCLAGFMRILSADFVSKWPNRILNIHPSLLPAFKGLETHKRALEAGVRLHGATVHVVRAALDDGPILIQAAVPVFHNDNPQTLSQRVLAQEHKIYPVALKWLANGDIRIVDDRVVQNSSTAGQPPNLIWPPVSDA